MPIFEYTCRKCGKVFEKLILRKKVGEIGCPGCGSKKTELMFSAFATASAAPSSSRASCGPSGGT
jgi:putative FmdB family regulatory protein